MTRDSEIRDDMDRVLKAKVLIEEIDRERYSGQSGLVEKLDNIQDELEALETSLEMARVQGGEDG